MKKSAPPGLLNPLLPTWFREQCLTRAKLGLFLSPETIMNKEKYVNLLISKLGPHSSVHKCQIFMHDGAPCYHSKVVKKYLEERRKQTLEWPGNSPDLNPINSLWKLMKSKVSEKHRSNLATLQTAIKKACINEIFPDCCCKLIESMPRRLQEVSKHNGGRTNY